MASTISAGTTAGTAIAVAGDTTGNLAFQTNGTTTAMTINTSQDIGIGTTSPQNYGGYKTLTINGSTGGILQLQANGTSGLRIVEGASQLELFEERNVPMLFATNNTERMRIDSSGNVFVGGSTQNTANKPVYSQTTAKAWVYFSARTGTTVVNNSFNISSVTYSSTGQFVVNFTTAMSNANYVITTGTSGDIAGSRTGYAMVNFQNSSATEIAPTTSSFAIATAQPSSASYNSYYVYAAIFSS